MNYLDMLGFPESGRPLLQNAKGVTILDKINPELATGWFTHTTGTGVIGIANTPVTSINSGDNYIQYSPSAGTVYSYLNTGELINSVFVPYNGATQDVDINIHAFKSNTNGVTINDSFSPNATQFYTNYPNLVYYVCSAYVASSGEWLYDYYGDGYLYDSMYSIQASINYIDGYIDTTGFNSYVISDFYYTYYAPYFDTYISCYGSSFNNGLSVTKNNSSNAGSFYDGINTVYIGDGNYAINAYGNSYFNGTVTSTYFETYGEVYTEDGIKIGVDSDLQITHNGTIGTIKNYNSNYYTGADLHIDCGADKTVVLDETVWNDIQFQISSGRVSVANFPDWDAFTANTYEYKFAVNDYIDLGANEMMHDWKEGTAVYPHLHLTLDGANSSGSSQYVKFTLYFAYADANEVWTETSVNIEEEIPTGTADMTHILANGVSVALTNNKIGSQVKIRIKRISATSGTEYPNHIFVTQCGMHYEVDTIGSRQIGIK